MLKIHLEDAPRHRAPCTLDVDLLSVATAVPPHLIEQKEAAERAKRVFPVLARLYGIYENAGIETRYTCVEPDWCHRPHGWEERTEVFHRHALDLLEKDLRRRVLAEERRRGPHREREQEIGAGRVAEIEPRHRDRDVGPRGARADGGGACDGGGTRGRQRD